MVIISLRQLGRDFDGDGDAVAYERSSGGALPAPAMEDDAGIALTGMGALAMRQKQHAASRLVPRHSPHRGHG